jgi:hypothetical protein
MEEKGAYSDANRESATPTTQESGPAGNATSPGGAAGGNKRDPMSASPSMGQTIAGRNLDGEGIENSDDLGGGVHDDGTHQNSV